jgi:hypothetical protein
MPTFWGELGTVWSLQHMFAGHVYVGKWCNDHGWQNLEIVGSDPVQVTYFRCMYINVNVQMKNEQKVLSFPKNV